MRVCVMTKKNSFMYTTAPVAAAAAENKIT